MKFLVVDDSALDRHLLVSLLQGLGHEVDNLSTALGAMEKICDGRYTAIFLDIVMPEQDGYKFLRSLRANQQTCQQKVIFCSSKKTSLEIDYGIKRAGADDYLIKPATTEKIIEVLEKFT